MIVTAHNYKAFDDVIGGKAKELFRLSDMSGQVPGLFAISSDAFRAFISQKFDDLARIIQSESDLHHASRECNRILEDIDIDTSLQQSILANCDIDKLYSVRSSALQEDSADHSFAGLFDTFLFVPTSKIISRLKQCWLSAFNPNIIEYCRLNHIHPLDIQLGVVIQEMIHSTSSGIIFTANPAGSPTEVIIVAGYGLGEGIVSNRVETDTYIYDTVAKQLQKDINHKPYQMVFDEESGCGVIEKELPPQFRDRSVLDDTAIFRLLDITEKLSNSFAEYLDIEWAICESGEIYILQSRPITTIPKGRITVFDNSNIAESYPNITLPLTASIAQKGYEANFYNFFSSLRLPYIRQRKDVFRNLVGYIQGRLYYNLTNWYEMGILLPIPTRYTVSSFDDMVGTRRSSNFETSHTPRIKKNALTSLTFLLRTSWKFVFIEYYFKKFTRDFQRLQDDFNALDLNRLDNHALIDLYHDCFDRFTGMVHNPLANDFFIMLFTGITKKLLGRLNFADSDTVFNGLMCGEAGMESVLPVHSVLRMAQMLRENDKLFRHLSESQSISDRLDEIDRGNEFRRAFEEHIALYGNRAPEELKMEVNTYKENPSLLLKNILSYVPLDITAEKMADNERAIRREAEREYSGKFHRLSLRKLFLNFCISRVRLLLKNRESGRLDRGITHGMFRSIFLVVGRNLRKENAIGNEADIFYLTAEEINNYLYGISPFDDLKGLIHSRKQQFESYEQQNPEERLYFSGTIPLNFIKQKRSAVQHSDNILIGIPCSPGKLECEAVVVHTLADAADVTGKIIVAKMTDPGWVFLMIAAAGIIVEKGSILSHTAIVGRELGIPTIVGIQNVTEIIKTGQVIKMDAYSGKVEIKHHVGEKYADSNVA